MLSNATSTAGINQHQGKGRQGEEDDRSRAVHTRSGQRGAGTKGRREVDAHSRQTTAPLAGKVWQALTDPAQLREWAPFDADRSLSRGDEVRLAASERRVRKAVRRCNAQLVAQRPEALTRDPKPGGTRCLWQPPPPSPLPAGCSGPAGSFPLGWSRSC